MNFGSYAILDQHRHELEKDPQWYWAIKSPTVEDEIVLAKFIRQPEMPLMIEVAAKEVALSFGHTTIPKDPDKPVAEGGEPLIKRDAPLEDVEAVVNQMPSEMLMELWKAVGEAVPIWGPSDPKAESEGAAKSD